MTPPTKFGANLPPYPIPQPASYQYPVAALLMFYNFTNRADYLAKMGVAAPDYDDTQAVLNWVDPLAFGGVYVGPFPVTTINGVEYIVYPTPDPRIQPHPVIVPVKLAGIGNLLPSNWTSAIVPPGTASVYRALLANETLVPAGVNTTPPAIFAGSPFVVQRTDVQAQPAPGGSAVDLTPLSNLVMGLQSQITQIQQEVLAIAVKIGA